MDLYQRLQKRKTEYKLTILILTLPSRFEMMEKTYRKLRGQSINYSVQILWIGDNKSKTVGDKRNDALSMADGQYITFLDDDDWYDDDFFRDVFNAMKENPECITFNVQYLRDGKESGEQRFDKIHSHMPHLAPRKNKNEPIWYKLRPNHLAVWRKDVIKESFPSKNLSEDNDWANLMHPHYNHVINIDKVLYYYNYSKKWSETH